MKKANNVSIFITFLLSVLGWAGIASLGGKIVGKGAAAFIARNPKSRGRQFAGGFIIGLFWSVMYIAGKIVGGKIADVLIAAQRPDPDISTPARAYNPGINTEEDTDDEDIWEPSIEMEPKMSGAQV